MQSTLPLACFLSMIRPPGVQFENSLLQIAPVEKAKCPFMRDHNDIEFRLYTRHNPTVYQELIIEDDEKLFASNIDYHDPTVVFFHAFMETTDDGSAARVRESYIIRGDTNIIMVDASRLEAGPWYFTAAENTWYIGQFAAKFVDYLVSRGLDLKKTHFVGHSLGAQAAGVAGSALKTGRVSRITGLDPALPLFHGLPEEQRLDKSDADFVDVIHTDGGIFGVNKPVGHADFYPNGGISPQPGCELEVVIPQHMLLNKCENETQPQGFYTFHLTPYKSKNSKTLERRLHKLFTKIHLSKPMKKNEYQPIKVNKKDKTFTSETKQTKKEFKSDERNIEDQVIIESVRRYYEAMPYFIAINNKDYIKTDTMDTIDKEIDSYGIQVETDKETIPGNTFKTKEGKGINEKALLNNDEQIHNKETINENDDNEKPQKIEQSTLNIDHTFEELNQNQENVQPKSIEQETFTSDYKLLKETKEYLNIKENEKDSEIKQPNKDQNLLLKTIEQETVPNDQTLTRERKEFVHKENSKNQELKSNNNQGTVISDQETTKHYHNQDSTILEPISNQTQDLLPKLILQDPFNTDDQLAQENKAYHETQPPKSLKNRQKRFINPFRRSEDEVQENFLFRMLNFLFKNHRNIPVYSVFREINTLVKSGQGELNHVSKERNNFIGAPPPINPVTYSLELGNESRTVAFVKKLLGLTPKGDRLTISGTGK